MRAGDCCPLTTRRRSPQYRVVITQVHSSHYSSTFARFFYKARHRVFLEDAKRYKKPTGNKEEDQRTRVAPDSPLLSFPLVSPQLPAPRGDAGLAAASAASFEVRPSLTAPPPRIRSLADNYKRDLPHSFDTDLLTSHNHDCRRHPHSSVAAAVANWSRRRSSAPSSVCQQRRRKLAILINVVAQDAPRSQRQPTSRRGSPPPLVASIFLARRRQQQRRTRHDRVRTLQQQSQISTRTLSATYTTCQLDRIGPRHARARVDQACPATSLQPSREPRQRWSSWYE